MKKHGLWYWHRVKNEVCRAKGLSSSFFDHETIRLVGIRINALKKSRSLPTNGQFLAKCLARYMLINRIDKFTQSWWNGVFYDRHGGRCNNLHLADVIKGREIRPYLTYSKCFERPLTPIQVRGLDYWEAHERYERIKAFKAEKNRILTKCVCRICKRKAGGKHINGFYLQSGAKSRPSLDLPSFILNDENEVVLCKKCKADLNKNVKKFQSTNELLKDIQKKQRILNEHIKKNRT
jgi:hypothetical protein